MKLRPGAVIRGTGVVLAGFASGAAARSGLLFAAYTVGWFLDKPGLQVLVVVPDSNEPWKRDTIPFATSAASWSTVMLAATTALRRTRLPVSIAALALGSGVVVIDSLLADRAEADLEAAKAAEADLETAETAETAEPASE